MLSIDLQHNNILFQSGNLGSVLEVLEWKALEG